MKTANFETKTFNYCGMNLTSEISLKAGKTAIWYNRIREDFPRWFVEYVGEEQLPPENRVVYDHYVYHQKINGVFPEEHTWEWSYKTTDKHGAIILREFVLCYSNKYNGGKGELKLTCVQTFLDEEDANGECPTFLESGWAILN